MFRYAAKVVILLVPDRGVLEGQETLPNEAEAYLEAELEALKQRFNDRYHYLELEVK
jgi:hypothetical protein